MLGRPPNPVNPNTTRANRAGTACKHVRQKIQVTAHQVFYARRNRGRQRLGCANGFWRLFRCDFENECVSTRGGVKPGSLSPEFPGRERGRE